MKASTKNFKYYGISLLLIAVLIIYVQLIKPVYSDVQKLRGNPVPK